MSVVKITYVFCDYPDCDESFGDTQEPASTTRARAREDGWTHSARHGDACPAHRVSIREVSRGE